MTNTTTTTTVSRAELAEAFEEWERRAEANPEEFGDDAGEGYGVDCADYLITLINEAVTSCRSCGCTNAIACEGGCSWVEADLCSRCGS